MDIIETLITTNDKTKMLLSCPDGKLSHQPNYIFVKANSNENGASLHLFFITEERTLVTFSKRLHTFWPQKTYIRKLCYININVVSIDRTQVTFHTAYYYYKCRCGNYQPLFEIITKTESNSYITT